MKKQQDWEKEKLIKEIEKIDIENCYENIEQFENPGDELLAGYLVVEFREEVIKIIKK